MRARLIFTLAAFATLQGCGSLTRLDAVPPALTEKAVIPEIPNARVWLDRDLGPFMEAVIDDLNREIAALEKDGSPTDRLPPVHTLSISGGGDAGAFAAGILSGWTAHGDRPQFRVVTGTSAGALIAPFAFLGPEYDETVRSVAVSIRPEDIFDRRSTLRGLTSDGMASSEPLARIIAKYVTAETLAAIAREYARGRALEVATTDLDAGRQVVWNMGVIAASGAPDALDLFRKILIASASVPGVVSPVMLDVEVDGRRFQEMHVDGGVISQVFLYPSQLLQELTATTGKPLAREIHTYVIRNGRLEPAWSNTRRRTLDIGGRAINSLVQVQGINDVQMLYQTAQQDRADFNLAYIGADFEYPHAEEFNPEYMRKLFEYGHALSASGKAWHTAPPSEQRQEPLR
jgi:predicted acylesterase/phospholipase RssA